MCSNEFRVYSLTAISLLISVPAPSPSVQLLFVQSAAMILLVGQTWRPLFRFFTQNIVCDICVAEAARLAGSSEHSTSE